MKIHVLKNIFWYLKISANLSQLLIQTEQISIFDASFFIMNKIFAYKNLNNQNYF